MTPEQLKAVGKWSGNNILRGKHECQGIGEPAPGCGNAATVPQTSHRWIEETQLIEEFTVWICQSCADAKNKALADAVAAYNAKLKLEAEEKANATKPV